MRRQLSDFTAPNSSQPTFLHRATAGGQLRLQTFVVVGDATPSDKDRVLALSAADRQLRMKTFQVAGDAAPSHKDRVLALPAADSQLRTAAGPNGQPRTWTLKVSVSATPAATQGARRAAVTAAAARVQPGAWRLEALRLQPATIALPGARADAPAKRKRVAFSSHAARQNAAADAAARLP